MPSFTKGKWELNDADLVTCHSTGWAVVALIFDTEKEEGRANARLITAAPEMYKWIEDARRFLFDLKRYVQDEDEMRSHAEEMNSMYQEIITTSDLLLVRIDGKEDKNA